MRKGRPTKLTPAVKAKILEALRAGNYLVTACHLAGIGDSTYHQWIERGRAGEQPYADFMEAVKTARAEAEADALGIVLDAARDSWQAAAWYLERSHAARWARRTKPAERLGPDPSALLRGAITNALDADAAYEAEQDGDGPLALPEGGTE